LSATAFALGINERVGYEIYYSEAVLLMWHVSAIRYGIRTAGVSPYLEKVVQESGHAAMKCCLVEFL
jgi:hypothetical protein